MQRLAYLTLVLSIIVAAVFIAATTGELPDRVASHFGRDNVANGWMTRDGYLAFTLFFATAIPAAVTFGVGWLPRWRSNAINLPNRDIWLDPRRRDATMAALATHAAWLGALLALFIAAIHYLILVANRASPPRLPADLFWMLVVGFLAAVALWVGALYVRFRNVP
jgi:uncharacterized membrane protein